MSKALGRRQDPLPDRLETTPVFDTYWRFAAKRQSIYLARWAGQSPPWTDDEVLATYRFTNVYRAADRVSQALLREVLYDGLEEARTPHDTVFRALLFKIFNRVSTWRRLSAHLGPVDWDRFDLRTYESVLDGLAAEGPIYSAAYIVPPPRLGAKRKHHNHLRLLVGMMESGLVERLQVADSLADVYRLLESFPSVGRFLAYQFTIDLNYSPILDFDEDEFVVAGPGAIDGIRKCFGLDSAGREDAVIRYMVDSQEHHFQRLGFAFPGLFGRRLHLIDCQNLFCEVDKYSRVAHPDVPGLSGRTRIKQRFAPVSEPMTAVFPPRWKLDQQGLLAEPSPQAERHEGGNLARSVCEEQTSLFLDG